MRELFAAPIYVLGLMACTIIPYLWVPYTGKGPPGTYVDRVERDDSLALLFPPSVRHVVAERLPPVPMQTGEGWHIWRASMPLAQPAQPAQPAQHRLLVEAAKAVGKGPHQLGTRPTLWCADFINKTLSKIGVRGTGSALAASFRTWGKAAKPAPGVVALKPRRGGSGHVVIVKAVKGNTIIAISGNSGGKVRLLKYAVRQFTAFRAPA